MNRSLLFASAISLAGMSPAHAMNWCGILDVIPSTAADFDRMSPKVEASTGCSRQSTDSAHHATWLCPDDPTTVDEYEGVRISFFREPGKSVHMAVFAAGLTDLDRFRRCGRKELRDGPRFKAGNVAYRDKIELGTLGPQLTLTAVLSNGLSAIVSDGRTYKDDGEKWLSRWFHGITTDVYPTTEVRLAGGSPISNNVSSIVAAFQRRGSGVKTTEDLDGLFPKWTLSPPTGLAGVREVTVNGFIKHLLTAEYTLSSTADYERYIGILDSEYGKSRRVSESGCTYRWWESGSMTIQGEHCPGNSSKLRFRNEVALAQMQQVAAKLEADKNKPDNSPDKQTIDRDML